MEKISLYLNNENGYDAILTDCLQDTGDATLITKDHGMESGAACAILAFTVMLPNGEKATAQMMTSVKLLKVTLAALNGRYDDEGQLRAHLR